MNQEEHNINPLPLTKLHMTLSKNLKNIIAQKKLSQTAIVTLCKEKGYKITQGTVSNAIQGKKNITLDTIAALADVLETDISVLLTESLDPVHSFPSPFSHSSSFITKPDDLAFQGYLGDYSLLFYRTSGKTNDLLHGNLSFQPSSDGRKCNATLLLPTGDYKTIGDTKIEIQKEYFGELVISKSMHSAYTMLYNENIGELSLLVFHHWYILNNTLKCAMASAITTSSGSNRRPTTHRACIIQGNTDITTEMLPFIQGQLLLNDSDIIISRSELTKLLHSPIIPNEFKNLIKRSISKENYCILNENLLSDTKALGEAESAKWISYVRYHSIAAKYNKISKRTDDSLFSLLFR